MRDVLLPYLVPAAPDHPHAVTVGDAQDNYMAFYDPSELPALVELL